METVLLLGRTLDQSAVLWVGLGGGGVKQGPYQLKLKYTPPDRAHSPDLNTPILQYIWTADLLTHSCVASPLTDCVSCMNRRQRGYY